MPGLGQRCWICDSEDLQLEKPSNIANPLTSKSFSITDSHYGVTAAIYRCLACGFLECSDSAAPLPFYENLVDPDYEAGRKERSAQARRILELVRKRRPRGRLIDIGAGSGMLVEQAIQMGYQAEGVEPSAWLHAMAVQRNLPVHLGTFSVPGAGSQFDIVTLIDVIEHVCDPIKLLQDIAASLSKGGIAIIVTPDVGSVAARIFGWRWWHFRVAHVGYFNKRTLFQALDRAGLDPIFVRRPVWFFSAEYLWIRLHQYLPKFLRLPQPGFLKTLVIPVNLRDSLLVGCMRKSPKTDHAA